MVFPSSTEAFGNVVLESMASGTPVIGSDSGGVKELIGHGKTGLLCPPRQPEAFVRNIARLATSPSLLHTMNQKCREFAEKHAWETILDQLLVQYDYAIEQHRKKQRETA